MILKTRYHKNKLSLIQVVSCLEVTKIDVAEFNFYPHIIG
jgi:hypothetical protein